MRGSDSVYAAASQFCGALLHPTSPNAVPALGYFWRVQVGHSSVVPKNWRVYCVCDSFYVGSCSLFFAAI